MGKKFNIIVGIVFFPITIFLLLIRFVYRLINKKLAGRYINSLDIENIDILDGFDFEELLYHIFNSAGLNVTKTKKSRDYGADLILSYKDKKIVIQSKLYYNHSVGNSAVQEIATAKSFYNADAGVVITNSHFSKPAINLASTVGVKLIERNELAKLLKSNKKDKRNMILNILE